MLAPNTERLGRALYVIGSSAKGERTNSLVIARTDDDLKEAWVRYRNKYILRVAVDLVPPQAAHQAPPGGKGAGPGKPYHPLGRDAAPSTTVAQQLIPAVRQFHNQQGWTINEFSIKYHAFQLSQRAESETEQALSSGLISFVPSVWPSNLDPRPKHVHAAGAPPPPPPQTAPAAVAAPLAPGQAAFSAFLVEAGLSKHEAALRDATYIEPDDLRSAPDDELLEVGLTKVEVRRLRDRLSQGQSRRA